VHYSEIYENKTKNSKAIFNKLKNIMPGGISHNLRFYEPYPVVMTKGKGSEIFDVDDNVYKDLWMGHYSHIAGHAPDFITKANELTIPDGTHLGTVNPYELELAEKIKKHVPSIEMLRFCTSGTEANMYAIRLARGYTQKELVVKMAGGWHGAGSELSRAIKYPYQNGVSGIFKKIHNLTQYIYFNDIERSFEILQQFKDNIACIILEPVIGEGGFLPANIEFLHFLREQCSKMNSLLIFDEVITGFRLGLSGAQGKFNVIPDLTTMGKIAGGGFNIGIVGGKKEIMELSSPFYRGDNKVLIGGGTFSATPYTMRAGFEMIKFLENKKDEIFKELNEKGEYVRSRISDFILSNNINAVVTGTDSLYMIHFPYEKGVQIKTPEDIGAKTDIYKRENEFKVRLLNEGLHVMHGGGAISYAHSYEDLDFIIEKTCKVLDEMK
jgi:glutamate-1-semialdehyde 2,1-aminomutase